MTYVQVIIGMVVGDFAYEWITGKRRWELAIRESWMMTCAVIATAIALGLHQ